MVLRMNCTCLFTRKLNSVLKLSSLRYIERLRLFVSALRNYDCFILYRKMSGNTYIYTQRECEKENKRREKRLEETSN